MDADPTETPQEVPAPAPGAAWRARRAVEGVGARMTLVLPLGLAERLRARSRREGRSLVWYVATAIGAYLDAADAAEAGR